MRTGILGDGVLALCTSRGVSDGCNCGVSDGVLHRCTSRGVSGFGSFGVPDGGARRLASFCTNMWCRFVCDKATLAVLRVEPSRMASMTAVQYEASTAVIVVLPTPMDAARLVHAHGVDMGLRLC